MRSLLLGILLAILLVPAVRAQQDAQFTMYMFNRYVLNPAYAGAIDGTQITGLGRAQWVGVPGAPNTATLSVNARSKKLGGGIGGYLIGDQLGPLRTVGAKASYAYHLNLGSAQLNIGVGGGIYQKSINAEWIYSQDPNAVDPTIGPAGVAFNRSVLKGDLDAGLYFHIPMNNLISTAYPQDKFYLGAAVNHILEPKIDALTDPDPANIQSKLARNISATAGFTFDLGGGVYLQPSGYFRMAGPLMQWDMTANLYVSPMVFGISHRWKDSFSGIVGFNASTYMFVGYSYDYTLSGIGSFTTGSHELIVSYTIPSRTKMLPPAKGTRNDFKGIF